MYFCYNLEKEEGSLKTELKNCLPLYKIFYSCAFILILCVIHPIIYYEEIGSAIQSPIAFLTIIFCSDTYLMEVKSKRADVFHLYDQKKQLTINEQISDFAQTYPTNLKASSNEALLFMRRYRFANCSCFSCCFKDAYPSSNVQ